MTTGTRFDWPLKFGTFSSPIHSDHENLNLALRRDLALVGHLDELGFDEAWIGEHHSTGWEFIGSPEMFIATRRSFELFARHVAPAFQHLTRSLVAAEDYAVRVRPQIIGTAKAARQKAATDYAADRASRNAGSSDPATGTGAPPEQSSANPGSQT
jgi:hypothetical protein